MKLVKFTRIPRWLGEDCYSLPGAKIFLHCAIKFAIFPIYSSWILILHMELNSDIRFHTVGILANKMTKLLTYEEVWVPNYINYVLPLYVIINPATCIIFYNYLVVTIFLGLHYSYLSSFGQLNSLTILEVSNHYIFYERKKCTYENLQF